MKTIKIDYNDPIPDNFTGIAEYPEGEKEWYKEGNLHREDGSAFEIASRVTNLWYLENKLYLPGRLSELIESSLYLGKEKGKYDLEWLRFLTEKEIEEFPIMSGMKENAEFKMLFKKLEEIRNK
jgi:hypothetical protein